MLQTQKEAAPHERRLQMRYSLVIKGRVQILLPEETFTPPANPCDILDVSATGMKICITQMEADLFTRMLKTVRIIRVSFNSESDSSILRMVGKIVWIDYEKDTKGQKCGACFIGISLNNENTDLDRYHHFLATLTHP